MQTLQIFPWPGYGGPYVVDASLIDGELAARPLSVGVHRAAMDDLYHVAINNENSSGDGENGRVGLSSTASSWTGQNPLVYVDSSALLNHSGSVIVSGHPVSLVGNAIDPDFHAVYTR